MKEKVKAKPKLVIVISIIILLLLAAGIYISYRVAKSSNSEELLGSDITFKSTRYLTIDNMVVYQDSENLDEEILEDFRTIAKKLKPYYPDTQLLYLDYIEENHYRFQQMSKNVVLDETYLNIEISDNGDVSHTYNIGSFQRGDIDDYSIKISEEEAKTITLNYLSENKDNYETLKSDFIDEIICTSELYYYNNEVVWKMNFNVGDSYLMISIDTGKVVDSYFFNGIYEQIM